MSISDISKKLAGYLAITIFVFIAGRVYELFAHGVNSGYMLNAWLIPLIAGLLSLFIKNSFARQLWKSALVWLLLACIYKGVLDIYGTTNSLLAYYALIGGAQAIAALVFFRRKFD